MTKFILSKVLESPKMLCALSWPVTQAIDGGLKCLLIWKGQVAACQKQGRKSVTLWAAAVL